jgi:hypothetical protein
MTTDTALFIVTYTTIFVAISFVVGVALHAGLL